MVRLGRSPRRPPTKATKALNSRFKNSQRASICRFRPLFRLADGGLSVIYGRRARLRPGVTGQERITEGAPACGVLSLVALAHLGRCFCFSAAHGKEPLMLGS